MFSWLVSSRGKRAFASPAGIGLITTCKSRKTSHFVGWVGFAFQGGKSQNSFHRVVAGRSPHSPNLSPNIARPLFEDSRVASSWITSRCSTRNPSLMRRVSAAIQSTGRPKAENRPCTIIKSPSATIVPGLYFRVEGRLLTRLNSPSRPGAL